MLQGRTNSAESTDPRVPEERAGELALAWSRYCAEHPNIATREAAMALGVSEAELLATSCGTGVIRLRGAVTELMQLMPSLGQVIACTRNARAVHERRGVFGAVRTEGRTAFIETASGRINLRLLLDHWHFGFAVVEPGSRRLEFFDSDGQSVHRILLEPASDARSFDRLITRFASPDQSKVQLVYPSAAPPPTRPDEVVEVDALRARWRALRDVRDFAAILRLFQVSRLQALRLAGGELAQRVARASVHQVLKRVSASRTPLMVAVASPGTVQIHSGPIHRVETSGRWLAVRDIDFRLKLRTERIGSAWLVKKPTRDGVVTSIEIFDLDGETVALISGARRPGQAESESWRAALEPLPRLQAVS